MEKVRAALEVLRKYHFWILLSLIVLITFGTWYTATGDRASQFDVRKKAIEGQFGKMQGISGKSDHPSEDFINGIILRVTGDLANATDGAKKTGGITDPSQSLSGNVSTAAELLFNGQHATFKLPDIYPNNEAEQKRFAEDFWKVWNHKIEDIEKPPVEATNKDEYELDRTFR